MYLDANNLYGWAVFQKLPVNGFKWVKKLKNEKWVEKCKKLICDIQDKTNILFT